MSPDSQVAQEHSPEPGSQSSSNRLKESTQRFRLDASAASFLKQPNRDIATAAKKSANMTAAMTVVNIQQISMLVRTSFPQAFPSVLANLLPVSLGSVLKFAAINRALVTLLLKQL